MASDVNLQALVDLARLYADQRPGGANAFVPDSGSGSVVTLINGALAELYDLLISAGGHEYYVVDAPISIVAGTSIYPLPADFYQLQTVHLEWSSNDWEPVPAFEQGERMRLVNFVTWGRRTPKGFRLRGAQTLAADAEASIEFLPTPSVAVTGRVRYIPVFQPLTSLSNDYFATVNGWQKLVALKVAIELRAVAKLDSADLAALYQEQLARVQGLADQRAQGSTPQVVDAEAYRQVPEWAADRRWI